MQGHENNTALPGINDLMKHQLKNISASIHQRLLNKARETKRPFNELLQYYAMERFLYRLSRSPHAKKFILKGALMLSVWKVSALRSTRDIDLLGRVENNIAVLSDVTKEICLQKVEPDGLVFDPASIAGEHITEDADYEGVRIRFRGSLGAARVAMQIDVGFGDVIFPSPKVVEYPTILDLPAPRLRGYSRETMIAEKFEAMVKLGILNSRMKDFYDIWLLSRQFDFGGRTLSMAIEKTFHKRGTVIPLQMEDLKKTLIQEAGKEIQWRGFIRKNRLIDASETFNDLISTVIAFLSPTAKALVAEGSCSKIWKAPGPWSNEGRG